MKYLPFLIAILFIIGFQLDVDAQCAMCKATAESLEFEQAKGLNKGIIFLMFIPYILISGLVYVFFGDKIKAKIKSFQFLKNG